MSQIIASDTDPRLAHMLEGHECPAILVDMDYRILAANDAYRDSFGEIPADSDAHCFQVSHGYSVPCDQAGESCPLAAARNSGQRERVLHVHLTATGRQHVDVEMLPIHGADGKLLYFVELLKPVYLASAELNTQQMVGRSAAFNELVNQLNLVAPHDTSVLLLGESGTGKELAAQAIHRASQRRDQALVTVECAGLSDTLFESELFGHTKGAFTGATQNKPGLLEAAHQGTLFLDEIGDVPLGMQVKLLRLLETGAYRAVGSTQLRSAEFRLICATHKDLPAMVERGEFRRDLYYRINAFPVHLPALRERRDDLPLLARSILGKLAGEKRFHLTDSAIRRLSRESFPGNIRELRNILERAIIFAHSNILDARVLERCLTLPIPATAAESAAAPDRQAAWTNLKTRELQYLLDLLRHCGGDKEQAAAIAGISLRSLYRKLGAGNGTQ
ncbi:sigma 54-interacting transcriptional regulator [Haliea sp. E1-2-M8]|uniref:sigma-54 interaction domain-containing protein n=1 Tax=Haliea sp. E1-2-M8 TaxID=3064706 RepID=UPI002719BA14|nr:sigma 54-interacting transcriptional regulator [Haliea sp. E1-2-M8]MDO8860501.1 sigma 54-interacting transcriptional regulator [Haliea sp. E1-2-M8]